MQVETKHVLTAVTLAEQADGFNFASALQQLLDTPATKELWEYTLIMVTRSGAGNLMNEQERIKHSHIIQHQCATLYVALAPIWLANGRSLPVVTDADLDRAMRDWADRDDASNTFRRYFDEFKRLNPDWHKMIERTVADLDDTLSIYVCATIIKAVVNHLPDKLEPSAADIGGDMLRRL